MLDLNSLKDKKLGLVLEGGGARGAYQFGAIKALYEAGFNFEGITGTSIGALNGALLVQGGYEKLSEFWNDVRSSKIYEIDDETVLKASTHNFNIKWAFGSVSKLVKNIKQNTISSSEKMREYFGSFFDEKKIRQSEMDFGFVTFSLTEMKPLEVFKEDIPQGKLVDYLIASACHPVYGYLKIDEEKFVDGGVWDNLPINLLAKKGYKNIVAIRTKQKPPRRRIQYSDLNIFYIAPFEKLGRSIYFTEEKMKDSEHQGYFDAIRCLKGYVGKRFYYFPYSDDEFMSHFNKIDSDVYTELVEELSGNVVKSKAACQRILSTIIKDELKLKTGDTKEAFETLFELFGAALKVERFEIYNIGDFLLKVSSSAVNKGDSLPMFIRNLKTVKSLKLREIFYRLAYNLNSENETNKNV